MKLMLHIGVSKTGTTTIQKWLMQNHVSYSKHICYPSDALLPGTFQGNHRILPLLSGAKLVWKTDFALDLLERISGDRNPDDSEAIAHIIQQHLQRCINQADASGYDTLLLSNEHLSDRLSTPDINRFSERISPLFEAKTLIVYLRRQDAALLSLYAESLKHGSTSSFREFVDRNQVAKLTFDYERIIRDWSACGWQIIPRLYYEKASPPANWSLIGDFINLLNYDRPIRDLDTQSYLLNRSPSSDGLEALRKLNYLHGKIPAPAFFFLKHRALRLERLFQLKKTSDGLLLGDLLARYASGNHWIAKNYFGKEHLFRPQA